MSLKHNPFDNSYKGSFIKRKKVFESQPQEEPSPVQQIISNEVAHVASSPEPQTTHSDEIRESLETLQRFSKNAVKKSKVSREKPGRNSETLQTVSGESLDKNPDLNRVVGLQRRVLQTLFSIMQSQGSRLSSPIAISVLAEKLVTSVANVQNAVKELIKKGLISRKEFQRGRGGWTIYEMNLFVFTALDQEKTRDSLENLQRISSSESGNKFREAVPCSSSGSNISKEETTTAAEIWISVPDRLKGSIPLKQIRALIANGVLTEESVDESLWGFAYDLEKGLVKSRTGNTTAVLIGALKQGGYISEQYIRELKLEQEAVVARLKELADLKSMQLTERYRVEFENFRAEFPEEAQKLKPTQDFFKSYEPGTAGYSIWLDTYKNSILKRR